ncbi:hypothetical protein [Microbacterium sp. AK031]|uniref:hypothetical protein n=1 Tax=Microbacterium sp. AK031 TaxID=2723076 RepID=UPI002167754B|nr:hypothetical protein [Microbacterium sp. AK031]MCS3844463.1 hypothetical protein [Microbacterium sp. AK031]
MNVTVAVSSRIPSGVALGALGVLAWVTLSILTGGDAAHGDDESESPPGLVTSVVDSTLQSATDPVVAEVTQPAVSDAVVPIVQTVIAPVVHVSPPVGDLAAVASDTVTDVVVDPVTDQLSDSPVSHAIAPLVNTVADVPVVGELLDDTGATEAVIDLADAVDATTGRIAETLDTAVSPVTEALHPAPSPAAPDQSTPGQNAPAASPVGTEPVVLPIMDPSIEASPAPSTLTPHPYADRLLDEFREAGHGTSAPATMAGARPLSAPPGDGAHGPPGPPATSSSAAAGSSTGLSAGAHVESTERDALRAWKQTRTASDDDLPSSPPAGTDNSPD